MNKKSKVTNVQQNGTWEGQYGMMYKFEVEFENGDTGEYSSKSQDQTKFVVGQETDYEYIDGKFPKVKPVWVPNQPQIQSKAPTQKSDQNYDVQDLIVRQSSLKAAVDFTKCSDNGTVDDIFYLAEECYNWVLGKKVNTDNENFSGLKGNVSKEDIQKVLDKSIGKTDLPF